MGIFRLYLLGTLVVGRAEAVLCPNSAASSSKSAAARRKKIGTVLYLFGVDRATRGHLASRLLMVWGDCHDIQSARQRMAFSQSSVDADCRSRNRRGDGG